MANDSRPPSKRPSSGPDPWAALARELATNPDSPASLRIMSAVNAAMHPRQAAVDQVVQAIVEQLEHPGPAADAAVAAAVKHWQSACDAQATADLLASFREQALEVVERRRRQPPALESIVAGVADRLDMGYELGAHLTGLRGTWHRLWASISMSRLWDDLPEMRDGVDAIRAEFEGLLGRALSTDEWDRLVTHAHHHCDTVMKPKLQDDGAPKGP